MSGPVALILFSLRRVRILVLTVGVLLGAFQILLIAYGSSMHRSGGFSALANYMPPFLRELMGPAVAVMMSFSGIVTIGYFHLVVMGALVALSISIATTPASEVETGFSDFVLARPIARHWLITRTILVLVLAMTAVLGCMALGTAVGLTSMAPLDARRPSPNVIRALILNLALLMTCWGGIALAVASIARRRGAAGAIVGVTALAAFLLDYLGRLWKPLSTIAKLSPFRYYSPMDLIMGKALPLQHVVVLSSVAVAAFVTAYILFARRDITH